MHKAVLLHELVNNIFTNADGKYLDCTGGGGSHAHELYKKLSNKAELVILDRDQDAVARLHERFDEYKNIKIIHSNFADALEAVRSLGIESFDGVFADFGTSAYQLRDDERGFSFRLSGEIDMRMDRSEDTLTAKDLVNSYPYEELSKIIYNHSQEQFARRIARAIVDRRATKEFSDTLDLADVINSAVPKKFHKPGTNPSTKSFQALRIFVNDELKAIEKLMSDIPELVKPKGRFAAISFHELEDRIVKRSLTEYAKTCVCPPEFPICVCGKKKLFSIINKKPIVPDIEEVNENPLSRSAKLRVGERV